MLRFYMALRVDAWFFVGLAALLFFYSAFVFHYDGFTSADSFERQRAVESILSTGFPPKAFNAYSTSDSYVYPPFFDYLTAFLVKAFGASMVQAWGFMGVALAASAYVAAFFLAFHYFKDSASSALAAFFTATATRFARIEAFPSPESLGIVFSLVVFCLFFTQKSRLSGLLLGFTLWVHFRSFLTTLLLVVGFLAAWPLLGLKPKKGLWSDFLLPSIASMAVFLALFPSALSLIKPFHNPFILSSTPLQVFGPVFFLGFAGFALAHASREFSEVRLFYSFLVLFLLSGLLVSGSTFYRELLYFSFPVAFFSSHLVARLSSNKFAAPLAALLAVLVFYYSSPLAFSSDPVLQRHLSSKGAESALEARKFFTIDYLLYLPPALSLEEEKAVEFAGSLEGGTVLAGFVQGHLVPLRTGKEVVAGPFLEGVSDGSQRAVDLASFLKAGEAESLAVLEKYNSRIVLLGPLELHGVYSLGLDSSKFSSKSYSRLYDSFNSQVYSAG